MVKVRKVGLFAEKDNLEDAFEYVQMLIETLKPTDKFCAYTAVYVLYNTVLKTIKDEGIEVIPTNRNTYPFGTENKKEINKIVTPAKKSWENDQPW